MLPGNAAQTVGLSPLGLLARLVGFAHDGLIGQEGRAGLRITVGPTSVCRMCCVKAAKVATVASRQTNRPVRGLCPI